MDQQRAGYGGEVSTPPESPRRWRRASRWLVRIGALVLLFVACNSGGVAATTLFPSRADTLNYGADLRLSLNPGDVSAIQSPTIFGDIRMDFGGPGPGTRRGGAGARQGAHHRPARPAQHLGPVPAARPARARTRGPRWCDRAWRGGSPQARSSSPSSPSSGMPRGGVGRPDLRWSAVVASVWVASCVATFGVIGVTYQPERLDSFTTTGILGTVQRNADLLEGVETRAEQVTPYLKNLLALSAALQDKYAPQALDQPVAARLLLVSDIHGANQYALMKTIVEQERIDAVIDSGDLVNFGSATEADAAGIFKGIASLGVPYLFVKGNHDARSDVDRELLDRLAKVRNVVLLEPDDQTYAVESIHGRADRRVQRPTLVRRRQHQQRGQAEAGGGAVQRRDGGPARPGHRRLPRAGGREGRCPRRHPCQRSPAREPARGLADRRGHLHRRRAVQPLHRRRRHGDGGTGTRPMPESSPASPRRSTSRRSAPTAGWRR